MTDEYHCDDCGQLLDDCPFWIGVMKTMDDIDSGKIKMVRQSADEFIAELKALELQEDVRG